MHARVADEGGDPARPDPLLQQLPQRLARLCQRGERLTRGNWDINALRLLVDEARLIADACRRVDADALTGILDELGALATPLLDPPRLPDRAAAMHLAGIVERLSHASLPMVSLALNAIANVVVTGPTHDNGYPLLVVAPAGWWTRFGNLPAQPAEPALATAVSAAAIAIPVAEPTPAIKPIAERRYGDRRAHAREPGHAGGLPATREDLLRHVSGHLAADDAPVRTGGVLLLVADDSASHNAAIDPALHDDIGRFLDAQTAPNEHAAPNAPGEFLLFDPDRDNRLLGAWALTLRERIAHAAFGPADTPRYALFDIGVCPFTLGIHEADAMVVAARNAIDEACLDGRHGVFVARSHHAPINAALVDRIRFALDTNGFEVLFQPIVSLQGDETGQFQALLRLRDDAQVLHAAAEVIPAATQAGLIGAVDQWVLAHCVALLARHADRAHRPHLFVSQSQASLRDAQASARLRALLAEHRVAASSIVIELHSRDAAHAPAEAGRYSAAMQAAGAGFALSGFNDARDASLLDALRPGFVKLEPDLLRIDDADARDRLRARIDALHEQGVRVIAPRVEDARGAAALCGAGVDFIQGNFVQAADSGFAFDFRESVM